MNLMNCKHCGAQVVLLKGRDNYFKLVEMSTYNDEPIYHPVKHVLHSMMCPAQQPIKGTETPPLTASEQKARGIV